MVRLLTRRGALAGLLAGVASPALATAPLTSLRPRARPGSFPPPAAAEIVARAKLGGVTAFAVAGPDGALIEGSNAGLKLPPASVAKAVTALYSLETLGDEYRFATVLMGTGPVEGGVLKGDLILKGTGDPVFDTDALGGLVAQLKAGGITGITGSLYIDVHDLPAIAEIDAGQPVQAGYNPSISGMNLNYNRVYFEWRRSGEEYRLTMDARAVTYQPRVTSAKMRAVDEAWPVYTHKVGETQENWTVARPALGNGGSRWLPVRLPGLYAGDVLRSIAEGMGITLPSCKVAEGPMLAPVLASHVSPSARGLCGGMLRYSTNLTAEVLGLRASQARGAGPQSLAASAAEMNGWVGDRFGAEMALRDHSGLSDASRMTCEGMVSVLSQAQGLAGILKSIKVKDAEGAILDNPAHSIQAKTGTLHFVNSLAGYVTTADGAPLTFAIISADLARRSAIRKESGERPSGARSYARRARLLQQALIARWAALAAA
ncbi:MAG: D-alanyl-D-alanine carboxypeptidase/D-alanyl-D-alanine-endopeptidase [Pseudomonadota bacterium]